MVPVEGVQMPTWQRVLMNNVFSGTMPVTRDDGAYEEELLRRHVAQYHTIWDMMAKIKQVQFNEDTVLRHDRQNLTVKDFGANFLKACVPTACESEEV